LLIIQRSPRVSPTGGDGNGVSMDGKSRQGRVGTTTAPLNLVC